MSVWFGRVLMITAAAIGASIALPDVPPTNLPKFLPIVVTQSRAAAPAAKMTTLAGSIDHLVDTAEGLLIEGWVGGAVDGVVLVVAATAEPQRQEVLLLSRPDVAAFGEALFSGFRAVFPGVELSSLRCVYVVGPSGSGALRIPGDTCE